MINRVSLEVINDEDYLDYLIDECDYIYVFWKDDESWDDIAEKLENSGKDYDIYEMDSVTDEYRQTDEYLKRTAEDDRERLLNNGDIDFLLRSGVNYNKKRKI